MARKNSAEKSKVVAVRIDPAIERRLRLLAGTSGRKPSFFLQQLIEGGISALAQVRAGTVPEPAASHGTPDLFNESGVVHGSDCAAKAFGNRARGPAARRYG